MNILGISSDYHDSSVSLVVDHSLKNLFYEDRFSYQKHDSSFPEQAILDCLKQHNLQACDLQAVAYYENPITKSVRQLVTSFSAFPRTAHSFVGTGKKIGSNLLAKYHISRRMKVDQDKIHFVPHHVSHAAFAFLSSGFEESCVLTVDTVGEWISTAMWKATYDAKGFLKIDPLELTSFPTSLGLFYSAITGYLGFKVNDGECSTMALAAFGKPTFEKEIKKILQPKADGSFELDASYFNISSRNQPAVTKKFLDTFGISRGPTETFKFSCLDSILHDPENQKWADIAASAQKVFEETLLGLFHRAHGLSKSENICYSGGAALNCVANRKLIDHMKFKQIYIPADPGDGGSSAGAALYMSHILEAKKSTLQRSPYHGRTTYPELVKKTWLGLENESRHENRGIENVELIELNDDSYFSWIASELAAGKVIGLVHGNGEIGPRALGHRSVLARADDIALAKRISQKIKRREDFRPYACSLLLEEAEIFFEEQADQFLGRWMQTSFKIKESHLNKLQAVAHVDRTTRPQICKEDDDPVLFRILKEYKKITGVGALLNTSLNESGLPMAGTGIDGLIFFARSEIDILVVERILFKKNNELVKK